MGTSYTPTYRIDYLTNLDGEVVQTLGWPKGKRADAKTLAEVVAKYNESFQPGGCNAHLITDRGALVITKATLIHQATGRVVA